jgi:4-amino-4-deoxy-L-arabinose transferase-like glycosyltransferase
MDWANSTVILLTVLVPFFFLLVREIFGSTAVVWATFFYSFAPLNIFAGRSFMPDVPSLSFAIVGLYFFVRWVEHRKSLPLFFAAVAIAVSLLIKITNIIVLVPLAYLVVAGGGDPGSDEALIAGAGRRQRRRLQLAFFAAITLPPPAIWYWHAHQIAQEFYPIISSAPAGLESNLYGGTGRLRNKIWYPVSRRLFQR